MEFVLATQGTVIILCIVIFMITTYFKAHETNQITGVKSIPDTEVASPDPLLRTAKEEGKSSAVGTPITRIAKIRTN